MRVTYFLILLSLSPFSISEEDNMQQRIIENIFFVVAPAFESEEEFVYAQSISECAVETATERWSNQELAKFDSLLGAYAMEVQGSLPKTEEDMLRLLENGPHPMTEELIEEFTKFSIFIEQCIDKLGGQGLEY